jgi:hypothetical protein
MLNFFWKNFCNFFINKNSNKIEIIKKINFHNFKNNYQLIINMQFVGISKGEPIVLKIPRTNKLKTGFFYKNINGTLAQHINFRGGGE